MPRAKKPPACLACREADMDKLVQVGRTQYLCGDCAQTVLRCFAAKGVPKVSVAAVDVQSPREIVAELDKTIIGQAAAKNALSVAAWKHMQRVHGNTAVPPAHVLLYGPTGCGKTHLAKSIAKLMDVPFVSVDATTFSETGYKGRDVRDIIFDIFDVAETRRKAQNAVVFVDEFDKLSAHGNNDRQAYQRDTQHNFLTLLEGGKVTATRNLDTATLDVSGLLFIFAGAFSELSDTIAKRRGLGNKRSIGFGAQAAAKPNAEALLRQAVPQDFVQYGLEAELVGRIPILAPILPLTISDLTQILTSADGSICTQFANFFEKLGGKFALSADAAEELARIAHQSGTGARGLRSQLERIITDLLFNLPTDSDITITPDMVAKEVHTA